MEHMDRLIGLGWGPYWAGRPPHLTTWIIVEFVQSIMEKAAAEDEPEKAAQGAAAPRKKQMASATIDGGASGQARICDDVAVSILARLPARAAVSCTALSKHHRRLIRSLEFASLHCRLGAPLPPPHIAYLATAPIKRRPEQTDPDSVFHGFHLAGAVGLRRGDAPMMRALTGWRHLGTSYVNTCNGVVLLAPKEFSKTCKCTLWNPAVADVSREVTVRRPSPVSKCLVMGLGYGRRSKTYKLLVCHKDAHPSEVSEIPSDTSSFAQLPRVPRDPPVSPAVPRGAEHQLAPPPSSLSTLTPSLFLLTQPLRRFQGPSLKASKSSPELDAGELLHHHAIVSTKLEQGEASPSSSPIAPLLKPKVKNKLTSLLLALHQPATFGGVKQTAPKTEVGAAGGELFFPGRRAVRKIRVRAGKIETPGQGEVEYGPDPVMAESVTPIHLRPPSHRRVWPVFGYFYPADGVVRTLGDDDDEMETPLRTVLSEGVDGQIKQKSLYMDGTIYLLHLEKSAILAFDVDDETATKISIPGERQQDDRPLHDGKFELIEMSGRPCMVTIDGCCLALWLLTADHQWDQKCVILDESSIYLHSIIGVWDCGGLLVLYFELSIRGLWLYDVAKNTIFKADLPGELTVERLDYEISWGYKPTLVSPGSIVGEISQDLERRRNSSAHIAEVINPLGAQDRRKGEEATLNTVCLMEFLVRIMQKLPNDMRDINGTPGFFPSHLKITAEQNTDTLTSSSPGTQQPTRILAAAA
nr:unnamed protein product [Digitaria exilis]